MASVQPVQEVRRGRRRGQHLTPFERGVIQAGLRAGRSFRAIAREVGCSPSTVSNEVERGTPKRKSTRGRPPLYDGRRGQKVYEEHRLRCHRPAKTRADTPFARWLVGQVRGQGWSLDACVRGPVSQEGDTLHKEPVQRAPCPASSSGDLRVSRDGASFSPSALARFPVTR